MAAAAVTSLTAASLPPAALSRRVRGTNVPVSATLAPRSTLAIRLRVRTGLPFSPFHGARSKLVRRPRFIDVRGLSDGRRGDVMLNESAGDTDKSRSRRPAVRGIVTGSLMVSSPGERTGLPSDGGSPKDDATDGGGTEG